MHACSNTAVSHVGAMPLFLDGYKQDRGEAPSDPGYDKAMQGLRMLAKQNARISLSALLSWRKDVIEAVKVDPNASAAISLRKRVCSLCVSQLFFLRKTMR